MSNGEGQNAKMNFSGAMPPFSGSNYVKAFLQAVVTVEESATRHSKKTYLDDFSNGEEMQSLFLLIAVGQLGPTSHGLVRAHSMYKIVYMEKI